MRSWKFAAALLLAGSVLCQRGDAWNVSPVRNYPGSSFTRSLSIADLDNDGRNDVLLTSDPLSSGAFAGKLVWYRQKPDGELAAPRAIAGGNPNDHVAADLNHDGRTDLVLALGTAYISIYIAQPGGGFVRTDHFRPLDTQWQNSGGNNVVLYDVDGDGQRDIVMFAWHSYAAAFLLDANGKVRSKHGFQVPTQGYNDYAVGDVDHDGIDDLVASSMQGAYREHLMVFGPDGAGGLAVRASWTMGFNGINSVTVGDTDGDGLDEILFAWGGNVPNAWVDRILLNTDLTMAYSDYMEVSDNPTSIIAEDLNADGKDDVAISHNGWYSISTFLQSEDRLLPAQKLGAMTNSWVPNLIAAGDLNSDGCPDTAVANGGDAMMLQVFRGKECVLSPLPTVDYGVELRSNFVQAYPESFPDIYLRLISATLRTYRSGEMIIREPVMHIQLTAVPPYTVSIANMSSEWATCTVESSTPAMALVTCPALAWANESSSPKMDFNLYLSSTAPTQVHVNAWVTSGGLDRGEIWDTNIKNQGARMYADFTAGPKLNLDAARQRAKP